MCACTLVHHEGTVREAVWRRALKVKVSVLFMRSTSTCPMAVAGVRQPPPAAAPGVRARDAGSARHSAASTAAAGQLNTSHQVT